MQTEISRLISETVVALFQTNGKMLEWGDAFTAPFGLTSARWQILGAIAWAGQKQTAPQIAEQMGVSRQGAQKQLNLLTDDGLIATKYFRKTATLPGCRFSLFRCFFLKLFRPSKALHLFKLYGAVCSCADADFLFYLQLRPG